MVSNSLHTVRPARAKAIMCFLCVAVMPVEPLVAGDTNLNAISTDAQCLADLLGSAISCSGTDVSATLGVAQILDGCDYVGDTATIIPAADFSSGVNARYDIGLFLARDGGNAQTGACQVSVLPEAPAPFADLDFSSDPADQCGDIAASASIPDVALSTMTIPCFDSDTNGTADIGACVAWANTDTLSCLAPLDALPVSGSRCNCSRLDVGGLAVPLRTVEVRKLLNPVSDAGLFDLTIDLATLASSVGDGGTTGPVEILPGNQVVVGELASSGTLLSDYTSSIECSDQVGRCSLDEGKSCVADSTCANQSAGTCNLTPTSVASCSNCTSLLVPIQNTMATIACTITNTANPPGLDCDDQNPCTVDVNTEIGGVPSCSHTNSPAFTLCGDPDTTGCNAPNSCNASGQCIDRVDPGGTQCRSSSNECDTPEFCDGVSKDCPAEPVVPPGDECLIFRNGFELSVEGLPFNLLKPQ